MSRWRPERFALVGVDARQAAWRGAGGLLASCGHAALAESLAPARGATVHLVASPAFAVHWMQPQARGLASLSELRQLAGLRCAALFGGEPSDWHIGAHWRLDRPFACMALPRGRTRELEAALRAAGARPQWHSSWSWVCARAAHAFPQDGWCVLRGAGSLLLWQCRRGFVESLSTLRLSGDESPDALVARALDDIRLTAPEAFTPQERLHWLDTCEPAPMHPRLLALPPACEAGPRHEAACALAAATWAATRGRVPR